jgi:hypothetical protein
VAIEVIFKPLCDSDRHRGQHVEGQTLPTVAIQGKPRIVELCEECKAELYDPLVSLLLAQGREPDAAEEAAKGAGGGKLQCPKCGYTVNTRGAMRDHTKTNHGMSLSAIETELGHSLEGKPLTHKCRFCDQMFTAGQAQSGHERNDHPEEYAAAKNGAPEPPEPPAPAKAAKRTPARKQPAKGRAKAS